MIDACSRVNVSSVLPLGNSQRNAFVRCFHASLREAVFASASKALRTLKGRSLCYWLIVTVLRFHLGKSLLLERFKMKSRGAFKRYISKIVGPDSVFDVRLLQCITNA